MLYFVYSRHIDSGKEYLVGKFNYEKEAVRKIAQCYEIDKDFSAEGEFYYFIKTHQGG